MTTPSATPDHTQEQPTSKVATPPDSPAVTQPPVSGQDPAGKPTHARKKATSSRRTSTAPVVAPSSTADYERFLQAAEQAGLPVLRLDEIAEIRGGRRFSPKHLVKVGRSGSNSGTVVVTGRDDNDKFGPSVYLDAVKTALVPELRDIVADNELLRLDDLLLTLVGKPGKVRCLEYDIYGLYDPNIDKISFRAVASDRFAVVRFHDPYRTKQHLQFLKTLLESEPYRAVFRGLAGETRPARIALEALGQIKIPLLPAERRILIWDVIGKNQWKEVPQIEAMIRALREPLASVQAICQLTSNPLWRQIYDRAKSMPTIQLRESLAGLAAHARSSLEQNREEVTAFLGWLQEFINQADCLEQIFSLPAPAEQIVALQQWRSSLEKSDSVCNIALQRLQDSLTSDPPCVHDAVLNRCRESLHAIKTLSKRCEDEIILEFQACRTLKERISDQKSGFMDDLRIKRHSLSQVVQSIREGVNVLLKTVRMQGSIDADSLIGLRRRTFTEYLDEIYQRCLEMGSLVERLTEEPLLEPSTPLNLASELEKLKNEFENEWLQVSIQANPSSFLQDNRRFKPVASIGRNDFRELWRNIIDNAKRHGFAEKKEGAKVQIDLSFRPESQMIELVFRNNGKPMPEGMDTRRFGLRGEKAGPSGQDGVGGHHIKQIMDHVGGTYDVINLPGESFPVQIKLEFPICYEQ